MNEKNKEIMGFKRFVKHYLLGESVKEMELNRILDKVSKKQNLEGKERNFLDLYNSTSEEDMKDYMYLSKNAAFNKIKSLILRKKIVICDLYDRDGKIGVEIKSIENNFEEDTCVMKLKNGETHDLHDKFLYNLIYSNKKGIYSLQIQDEYYEPITIENK